MTVGTLPDLKGFETYYGLKVADIGDDGDLIILGHHHDDPLRVIAALNHHARTYWRLTNLLDKAEVGLCDLAGSLHETHAVVEAFDRHGEWCIRWNVVATTPDAFPVTMWRP